MGIDMHRGFVVGDVEALPMAVRIEAHAGWGKSWLARLSAPASDVDRKYGVGREFIARDGQSLSRKGNGTLCYTIAEPGLYEAQGIYRSFRVWRVVFRVHDDGRVERLADSESDNLGSVYRKLFAAALVEAAP